ncbi:hypothetical protein [Ornithinimicrobium kibberense]|uniref:hypothetical protein n=1 Tax=Ornithinimicrobium kibberense TaxID=282060 RepID=UPI00361A8E4C
MHLRVLGGEPVGDPPRPVRAVVVEHHDVGGRHGCADPSDDGLDVAGLVVGGHAHADAPDRRPGGRGHRGSLAAGRLPAPAARVRAGPRRSPRRRATTTTAAATGGTHGPTWRAGVVPERSGSSPRSVARV